jgi:DNA-binding transcriptional MerR regulator
MTIKEFFQYNGITTDDIPNIPLYMDQLLSLFEEHFHAYKRGDNEKILTKTMINNYVKSKVIEPPVKKKYQKDQIMMLALIYQLKNIMSIQEIKDFFNLFDSEDYSDDQRSQNIERYFKIYNAMADAHLQGLANRHKEFEKGEGSDSKKREFIARLLIEADLNKRLALMLLDEEETKKY